MRITDLIPWKSRRHSEPAVRQDGTRDPVAMLQQDVDRAVGEFLQMFRMPFVGWPGAFMDDGSGIQVDVSENDKEVKISAEMPGMNEKDIDVRLSDGVLVISGERKTEQQSDKDGYIVRERSVGRVERALPLPEGVDADAVEATFKGGVLTITIPKTEEARSSGKRIPVRSN